MARLIGLDQATTLYWEVMWAYNDQEREYDMTTEDALTALSDVLAVIGPHHPLTARVIKLRQDIIYGNPGEET